MTRETPEERPHSEFGPSGLKCLEACRGFKNRGGTSAAAEKGTRIHSALELEDPSELVDEDEYNIYLQLVADRDKVLADLEETTGIKPVMHQELRLRIPLGSTETFGTADIIAISGSVAVLYDAKTGVSKIDPPPDNWQSTAYAIGLFEMFPDVKVIHAVFSIPVRSELLEGYYYRDNLPEYVAAVGTLITEAAYVRRMWDGGSPPLEILTPNDNCRYCEFNESNRCPALGALVFDVVKRYDGGGALPAEGSIHGSDIEDPEVLAKMLPLAHIAEKWADGVKSKARMVAMRDGKFPGHVVKSMGSPREISDPVALKEFATECGFSVDEILSAATFSLSSLTKIVSAKAPRGQKQDAVRQFEDGLEMFGALTRKPERFSLKPLSGDLDDED